MTGTANEAYTFTQVPMVFVEPTQQPQMRAREEKGGLLISRGFLAVVAVLLFGALVASTVGLLLMRGGEQARWAEERTTLNERASSASVRAAAAETRLVSVEGERDVALKRIDNYDAVERQLAKIQDRTSQIKLLLSSTPNFPVKDRMDLSAIPDWTKPAVAPLEGFVTKLDEQLENIQAFAKRQGPRPPPPAPGGAPILTPTTPGTP